MANFQEMITMLTDFWAKQGCVVHQGYDLEVGAGTFNPATFLRCLGPEPYRAAYVELSRRPKDGRYGQNPNRVQCFHQMQVILKPSPIDIQDLYLASLAHLGLDLSKHDVRFVHDDWENPTIGAWGLGWEIWVDGMEISQFTYFQAVGGHTVKPVSGELTYGLERLAMYLQGVDSMFHLKWNEKITYGQIFHKSEEEWSAYNFEHSNAKMWQKHFDDFEKEAKRLAKEGLAFPAYDFVMKASHAFNMLDARGVISVTERASYIARIRDLARTLATSYLKSREELEYPLLEQESETPPEPLPPQPTSFHPDHKEDFLLEIGSEELPATFVPLGLTSLQQRMEALLKEHKLAYDTIEPFATPRRLALIIKGLVAGTQTQEIEKKGPATTAAFDLEGQLTKAGEGFFRSIGCDPTEATRKEIKGTEYLFATQTIPGRATIDILQEALPSLILSIDFPKKMRWSSLDSEYARPLRWIVALFGKQTIPFHLAGLTASNTSWGHRQLSNKAISLKSPHDYTKQLEKHHVMPDITKRKMAILDQLQEICSSHNATPLATKRVMAQVLHLVEWPFLTIADFSKDFLRAPKEVLISEMVEHQRYFPLANREGNLIPHFVIVCNNKPSDLIRRGNQRALSPRLADGCFLFDEDCKQPLESYNTKLSRITFQKELGSMSEKVQRILHISRLLHKHLPICELSHLERAATLSKADLATQLVGEFPELQGTIGRLYAHNEDHAVALAIDEQWMPRGEKTPLPSSPTGTLLSMADKIDNLLCFFAIHRKPTSSSDPFALRRQAAAICKMLIEGKHHLPLQELLDKAYTLKLPSPAHDVAQFIIQRLPSHLSSYPKEEVHAALSRGTDDPLDIFNKLQTLHKFRKEGKLDPIIEIHQRAKKILGDTPHKKPNPKRFTDPTEHALFEAIAQAGQPQETYEETFSSLLLLQKPVANLFDTVKIMDDDPKISQNRLALLSEVYLLCDQQIDFSQLY